MIHTYLYSIHTHMKGYFIIGILYHILWTLHVPVSKLYLEPSQYKGYVFLLTVQPLQVCSFHAVTNF